VIEALLPPSYIRDNYLRGLPMEGPDGSPLPDSLIASRTQAVARWFERKYGIRLGLVNVKVGQYPLEGEPTPDETYPGIDFHPDGNLEHRFHILRLPVGPVKRIHAFGLWLPGMSRPALFPPDWAHVNPRSHTVRVYPGKGLTFAVPTLAGIMANLVSLGKPVPHAWHFSYQAGYTLEELQGQDYDVVDALAKLVAVEVLVAGSIDEDLREGVASRSVSVDGLSQSVQLLQNPNALKYQPLINQYLQDVKEWEKTFWARQKGVRLGVI